MPTMFATSATKKETALRLNNLTGGADGLIWSRVAPPDSRNQLKLRNFTGGAGGLIG